MDYTTATTRELFTALDGLTRRLRILGYALETPDPNTLTLSEEVTILAEEFSAVAEALDVSGAISGLLRTDGNDN